MISGLSGSQLSVVGGGITGTLAVRAAEREAAAAETRAEAARARADKAAENASSADAEERSTAMDASRAEDAADRARLGVAAMQASSDMVSRLNATYSRMGPGSMWRQGSMVDTKA